MLKRVARRAQAQIGAVFVPRGDGLALVAQFGINQPALDVVNACWLRHQKELRAGHVVRFSAARLWPLFDGPEIAALVYLDRAPADFPDDRTRDDGALIAARAQRCGKPSALDALVPPGYRPADIIAELERDQLVMLLTTHRGNVTAVAGAMGLCRDTVYDLLRNAKPSLSIEQFRPRRRRRPRRP